MTEIKTKAALVEAIQAEHRQLVDLLSRLSDEEMNQPDVFGALAAKDVLAHITAWETHFLRWYEAGQRGEPLDHPAPGMTQEEVDRFNRQVYERNRGRDLADVRAAFDASYDATLAAVQAMTEADIFTVGRFAWTGEYPLLPYLMANTSEHYEEHRRDFQAWRRAQGRS